MVSNQGFILVIVLTKKPIIMEPPCVSQWIYMGLPTKSFGRLSSWGLCQIVMRQIILSDQSRASLQHPLRSFRHYTSAIHEAQRFSLPFWHNIRLSMQISQKHRRSPRDLEDASISIGQLGFIKKLSFHSEVSTCR